MILTDPDEHNFGPTWLRVYETENGMTRVGCCGNRPGGYSHTVLKWVEVD